MFDFLKAENFNGAKITQSDAKKRYFVIKKYSDKIATAETVEERVQIAKDWLLNTDTLRSENALCQFDDEERYYESNYLKKYLEYRKQSLSIYKNVDCDVSLLCVVMYGLLNDDLDINSIVNQQGRSRKYEFQLPDGRLRGDTLTSALHILKCYTGFLWKRIDNNDQLKRIDKYKSFYDLFQKTVRNIPYAPNGKWELYVYENSDIVWNAMDKEAKEFLRCYNMFGNYMCIPGNSYRSRNSDQKKSWISFNTSRSNCGKWDTTDILLAKIYGYYRFSDQSYLEEIFAEKDFDIKDKLVNDTTEWLSGFEDWSDFVRKNTLQSFVDKNQVPVSLKTGKLIGKKEIKSYDPIPQNYKEFLTFFAQFSKRVTLRSEMIFDKITNQV